MRRLASIHLTTDIGGFTEAVGAVMKWLRGKGLANDLSSDGAEASAEVALTRGRRGMVTYRAVDSDVGRLHSWELMEPTEGGEFRTTIQVASTDARTIVFVTLEAGRPDNVVAPTFVEARLPAVVRDILAIKGEWTCGRTPIGAAPLTFRGAEGGAELVELLCNPTRSVPIVLISDYEGLVLHPGIETKAAADLAGLAIVARANADACWHLTRRCGEALSCFHGAIRLYWPGPLDASSFRRHPLWTSANLLRRTSDTAEASRQIRETIRQRIFSASAMGIRRPQEILAIERAHRRMLLTRAKEAADQKSVEDIFDELNQEIDRLEAENAELKDQVDRLGVDLENERAIRAYAAGASAIEQEVEAAAEVPPATLEDAVRKAQEAYAEDLVFGEQVLSEGVSGMDPDAGPPEKVLSHLTALAELARELRKRPLGKGMGQWLRERGVPCSDEHPQTRANADERAKRRWSVGGERQVFSQHTKPNESTSPSKCVRIYYHWDAEQRKILIGWVGRHP